MKVKHFWLFIILAAIFINFVSFGQFSKTDSLNYSIHFLNINSSFSDFSPFIYENGLLFCSNRENGFGVVYRSENTGEPLSDIYFAAATTGNNFKRPHIFSRRINSELSEGPFSLTKDNKRIYFTKNIIENGRSRLNIFCSVQQNGIWLDPEPVFLGSEKYSYGHPAISPEGDYMIFVSNMPGGIGGTDLYISYLKEGKWSKPVNMGKQINSSGNEITPFIHEKGILYFASDRKGGMGGLDVYVSTYKNLEWGKPRNLGFPVNSSFNDFGIVFNETLYHGYFSSNRRNGGEDDDIYRIKSNNDIFQNCDTVNRYKLCHTFYEESTISTENSSLVYEWEMGDGTKIRGQEVKHCYAKPGKYTIQFNVVDLISGQVLINEATFEMEIKEIESPFIASEEEGFQDSPIVFDASKSVLKGGSVVKYTWDFGLGNYFYGESVTNSFKMPGQYKVRLDVTYFDSLSISVKNACVEKRINIRSKDNIVIDDAKNITTPRKIYDIKDSEGNIYKIQLATSDKPIPQKFKKFEGLVKVDEYYDRNVYAYTTGEFSTPQDAYPKLKMIRKIGFKEAVLIAMHKGKVVSGTDSSFYIPFNDNLKPINVIIQEGKITDKDNHPLQATIAVENLISGEKIEELNADAQGHYQLAFPDGELYGYSVSLPGYYPFSSNLDLREENSLSSVKQDITLYTVEDLINGNKTIKISNLFFAPERHEIQPESFRELNRIADFIKSNSQFQYEIIGHTDNKGTPQFNLTLSQKRAMEVVTYLVKRGCKKSWFSIKGVGNSQPLTSNAKMFELNRRVEIKIKND